MERSVILGGTRFSLIGAVAAAIAAWLGLAHGAMAQTYPIRAIILIIPVSPGGAIDMVTRMVAPEVSILFGQPVVVENRAGASQKIGMQALLSAPKDGYTFASASAPSLTINPALDRALGYDPLKDFTLLTNAFTSFFVSAVHPSLPVTSLPQLVAYGKANPGKLTYGTGGSGTGSHFGTQQLFQKLGITATAVHYKSAGPALNDLLGGHIQFLFLPAGAAKPLADKGRLVPLATTGPERLAEFPNVPANRETGIRELQDYSYDAWIGFVAAAGIPPEAARKLQDALVKVLRLPEVKKSLEAKGFQVIASTSEEFASVIRSELELNRKLAASGAIKAE